MTVVLASAADERYGDWLLNLVGSVHANANVFDRIEVYDLGLGRMQRRRLAAARGVELLTVPSFVPHWRQGFTWKTWIWRHAETETLLWLDAGVSVLRRVDDPLEQIAQRGYFAVSSGHKVVDIVPSDYYARFDLDPARATGEAIAAGIFGFRTSHPFFDEVIVPTYDAAAAGFSLGFSAGEAEKLAIGIQKLEQPIVRDCRLFRHDQTLLNIFLYRARESPYVNDVYQYGGWMSRHDHPEQVFWSHRRRGDFAYVPRVRYRWSYALQGRTWGVWHRARWWRMNHRWLLDPQTYIRWSGRMLARALRLG